MTALPQPGRLLTIAEYAALPEDDQYRWELLEGNLTMSPSPTALHNYASGQLLVQLDKQLPPRLAVIQDVDVDLRLAPPDQPGSARRPDLIVVERAALERVRRDRGLIGADDVRLVIELISPGSRRTDRVTKHGEYADAGIPYYWILDFEEQPTLVACHLAEGFGYQDSPAAVDTFESHEPFPVRIDLGALV